MCGLPKGQCCYSQRCLSLPRTQECLDAVSGSRYFSTLDITSAYNQIPVKEEDIPKTAFVTRYGLFEYTTMPFGLCNAPATFQRIMELALNGPPVSSIWTTSSYSGLMLMNTWADCVRSWSVSSKPTWSWSLTNAICCSGVWGSLDTSCLRRVSCQIPITSRRLLVGPNPRLWLMCEPCWDWGITTDVLWRCVCEAAFQHLKTVLTGPEVMAYPMDHGEFILDTNACGVSIGAVLSQVQDGEEWVIAYGSRTLNKSERNYWVTDKELLAVKHFIEHYKHYLLGRVFTVRTDHQALRWLFSLKEPKYRIARWIEVLSAYHFTVEYRPGKRHGNADAMPRCPNPRNCCCQVPDEPLKCGSCHKCQMRTEEGGPPWPSEAVSGVHPPEVGSSHGCPSPTPIVHHLCPYYPMLID